MISEMNMLAPRCAFALVITAPEGCQPCLRLNLRLLLCHHAQVVYGFLLPLPCYSGNGGHGRQGRLTVLFLKRLWQGFRIALARFKEKLLR